MKLKDVLTFYNPWEPCASRVIMKFKEFLTLDFLEFQDFLKLQNAKDMNIHNVALTNMCIYIYIYIYYLHHFLQSNKAIISVVCLTPEA